MPIVGLAVQSSLLRADGKGPSAIADFQGLDLRGALNQGHSRNTRQGFELPSLILLSIVPTELGRRGRMFETSPRYETLKTKSRPIFRLKIAVLKFLRKLCRFDDIDSIRALRFNIMHLLV